MSRRLIPVIIGEGLTPPAREELWYEVKRWSSRGSPVYIGYPNDPVATLPHLLSIDIKSLIEAAEKGRHTLAFFVINAKRIGALHWALLGYAWPDEDGDQIYLLAPHSREPDHGYHLMCRYFIR